MTTQPDTKAAKVERAMSLSARCENAWEDYRYNDNELHDAALCDKHSAARAALRTYLESIIQEAAAPTSLVNGAALPAMNPVPSMELSQFRPGELAVSEQACRNFARLYAEEALALAAPHQTAGDAIEPCPRGKLQQPDGACTNRHQCWEPCGELGNSMEHARVSRTAGDMRNSSAEGEPVAAPAGVLREMLEVLEDSRNALMESDRDCDYPLIERIEALGVVLRPHLAGASQGVEMLTGDELKQIPALVTYWTAAAIQRACAAKWGVTLKYAAIASQAIPDAGGGAT